MPATICSSDGALCADGAMTQPLMVHTAKTEVCKTFRICFADHLSKVGQDDKKVLLIISIRQVMMTEM